MMNPDPTATLDLTLQADDLQLWLNRVSRTFALTIRMLEEPFQTYASAAYLLCRIVDTVEDCETLTPELKCRYLRDFSARLKGSGSGRGVAPVKLFDAPATWEERLTLYESGVLDLKYTYVPADGPLQAPAREGALTADMHSRVPCAGTRQEDGPRDLTAGDVDRC